MNSCHATFSCKSIAAIGFSSLIFLGFPGIASADYVPIQIDDLTIVVPTKPKLPVVTLGPPTNPMDVFIKSVEVVSGGSSGIPYFIVVNVDPSKVGQYQVQSSDPYWLKYYAGMWQGGQFASAFLPNAGPPLEKRITHFNSPSDFIQNPAWGSGFGTTFPLNGYDRINNYKWAAMGKWATYYPKLHYTKPIVINPNLTFIPVWVQDATVTPGDKVAVYNAYPVAQNPVYDIYMRMRILTGTEAIVAGEVAGSGWGLVPMAATAKVINGFNVPYSPWVIIKPFNQAMSFNQEAGKAWVRIDGGGSIKPLEWNGITATNSDTAWQAMMSQYLAMDAAGLGNAYFGANLNNASMAFGGMSRPDYQRDGEFILVIRDPVTGQTTAAPVPPAAAVAYVAQYGIYGSNGSNNSVRDAVDNYGALSASRGGQPVLLVYHAQDAHYYAADESVFRNSLTFLRDSLPNERTYEAYFFSWTAHIGANVLGQWNNYNLHLVGPAHGEFGAGSAQFYSDLKLSQADFTVYAGSDDLVAFWGKGADAAAIAAVEGNIFGLGAFIPVIGAGHSFQQMLSRDCLCRGIR